MGTDLEACSQRTGSQSLKAIPNLPKEKSKQQSYPVIKAMMGPTKCPPWYNSGTFILRVTNCYITGLKSCTKQWNPF